MASAEVVSSDLRTISLPNGAKAAPATLKLATQRGMPMIVIQSRGRYANNLLELEGGDRRPQSDERTLCLTHPGDRAPRSRPPPVSLVGLRLRDDLQSVSHLATQRAHRRAAAGDDRLQSVRLHRLLVPRPGARPCPRPGVARRHGGATTRATTGRFPLRTVDLGANKNRRFQRVLEWSVPGSNRRPPACKAGALPAELTPLVAGQCRGAGCGSPLRRPARGALRRGRA
jgi:hypothetical protein